MLLSNCTMDTKIPASEELPGFHVRLCGLPVAEMIALPVAVMIIVAMIMIGADTDPDRADVHTNSRSIRRTGQQTQRNRRRYKSFHSDTLR